MKYILLQHAISSTKHEDGNGAQDISKEKTKGLRSCMKS
jgi:hypothetical protein